ncbi:MAG: hypothetical protein QOH11_465 [Solirubrobacteraceae bacterium]|jgi:hypothetical protein|nr:hypothetical protein [Solirubrobacteraceae bacterium]
MGKDPSEGRPPVSESERGPEEIREDIEATRRDMGDTVGELAEKTDVKAQAKRKLYDVKQSATGKKDEVLGRTREASPDAAVSAGERVSRAASEHRVPLVVVGALAAGFVTGRLTRR